MQKFATMHIHKHVCHLVLQVTFDSDIVGLCHISRLHVHTYCRASLIDPSLIFLSTPICLFTSDLLSWSRLLIVATSPSELCIETQTVQLRQTETNRQTDRQKDIVHKPQTDRQTNRQTKVHDRQKFTTDRQTDRVY